MKRNLRDLDKNGKIDNSRRTEDFADDVPSTCYNDENTECLNFKGCLLKYLGKAGEKGTISCNWKDNQTFNDYFGYFFNPRLFRFVDMTKPIADITQDDVDNYFEELRENPIYEWTENVESRCKQLFWAVYSSGFEHGEYDDQLYWQRIEIAEDAGSNKNVRKDMLLQRKSLSVSEELSVMRYFQENGNPLNADGRLYGMILMFFLGLRNNEAAGASFDNIAKTPDKDFHSLYIIKTTEGDTNNIKEGGKTYNASRILPLFPFLYKILMERKAAVEQHLVENGLSEDEAKAKVLEYPIACKGVCFEKRCTRNDITKKAKEVFKELNIYSSDREASLAELAIRLKDFGIEEKNATAYLCRRNVATHLYGLGFSPSQAQYYIGHNLEDENELRNYFTNPDRLEKLYEMLLKHPFNCMYTEAEVKTVIRLKPKSKSYIRIVADEPGQTISISMKGTIAKAVSVVKSDAPITSGYNEYIDISKKSSEVYRNKIKNSNR